MPLWAWAIVFVVLLGGIGWLTDYRARRVRRGLTVPAVTGADKPGDPVAEAVRIHPVTGPQSSAIMQYPNP